MKNIKGALFSSSIVFLLLSLAVLVFSFRNLGKWLMVSDPLPGHLDIVFTFAGENVRVSYSKELMSRFSDAHWMLSDYKDGHSRLLKRSNYDMSKVSVIDSCRNTYSEVDALMKRLSSQKEELHVGLVSGPYHMRRIKIMLSRYPETKNYHFYFLPVPLERYNWTDNMIKKWWRSGTVSSAVISEVQKIVYFFLVT
ncbi:MAG: hypothetical protein GX089_00640 [Fibrobacter sp.]|jgi:hypothetical protein|nr:hypothetical protein [Fibrobacter sp.]